MTRCLWSSVQHDCDLSGVFLLLVPSSRGTLNKID